ncbi:MAG: class I SAM-dependent methyltransferase [Thermomicrobiales bacterium]
MATTSCGWPDRRSPGQAVGIDVSETMIERARERSEGRNLRAEFIQASAYDLLFPERQLRRLPLRARAPASRRSAAVDSGWSA